MSQAKTGTSGSGYTLDPQSSWANAWKLAAAVAVVGIAGTAFAAFTDHERFAFSYLYAFIAFLTIPVGGVFFSLLQFLTSSGWSVTIRRTTEFLYWPLWIFVILFVPVALNMDQLYPWTADPHEASHFEHGAEHGVQSPAPGGSHGGEHSGNEPSEPHYVDPDSIPAEGVVPAAEHAHHAHVMEAKKPYLNLPFFYGRAAFYFLVWIIISMKLFTNSTKQDVTGDPELTKSSARVAPVFIALFALTTTFAAFDWLMSLEPSWISTIFGVNFFAQSIVSMFAVTILIALSLRAKGHYKGAVTVEHFHDLGKLQFGFLIFWAYVNFSQFMLIWYASLPEETTYYHKRWSEGGPGWKAVSLALIFGHFIIPFFVLISRNAKRALTPLGLGAAIILLFHFVMVYWLVMPYYGNGLNPSLSDLACLMAVGGIYFTAVLYRMTKHPLVPVRDPRLDRSLHFVNA
ncbi:MAG: hypothetical protein JWN48_1325 [Myxococcaceae bacterium]|nr:hypothetical protein [Myxococcaceae bacterium]